MTSADSPLTCPECGKAANGNFCQNCGAGLGGRFCNQCGESLPAGAKFCAACGAKVGAKVGAGARGGAGSAAGSAGGRGARVAARSDHDEVAVGHKEAAVAVVAGNNLPWWIAGGAMFVLILFVGISMVRPGAPAPPTVGSTPTAAGSGTPPDISNMSPLEAATRLFNRVMTAVSAGDSAQAQAFVPMAIAAYDRARPLDHDGLFHLSMLNRTAMNLEAALDNAIEILDDDPNHLLALASAAEASIEMGELDQAEEYYRRIAEVYDVESQRQLPEYADHFRIVEVLKDDAERFLAGR